MGSETQPEIPSKQGIFGCFYVTDYQYLNHNPSKERKFSLQICSVLNFQKHAQSYIFQGLTVNFSVKHKSWF